MNNTTILEPRTIERRDKWRTSGTAKTSDAMDIGRKAIFGYVALQEMGQRIRFDVKTRSPQISSKTMSKGGRESYQPTMSLGLNKFEVALINTRRILTDQGSKFDT